jgi:hypothetical protein
VVLTYSLSIQRLRQEDCPFNASLGYIVKPCFKKQIKANKKVFLEPNLACAFFFCFFFSTCACFCNSSCQLRMVFRYLSS